MREESVENLVIYGNGKIAKIVFHFLKNDFNVVAFTVDESFISDSVIEGVPVVPFENIETKFSIENHKMIVAVGYVQMNHIRALKYQQAKEKGYSFANYIHPSVVLHDNVIVGENNVVMDHVAIQPYAKIGNGNIIWSNAVIAHGCTVENDNWIASGVVISGDTTIKSKCFMGVNATIGHNMIIENENFIGANALVTKSTMAKDVYITKEVEKFRLDSQRFLKFAGI